MRWKIVCFTAMVLCMSLVFIACCIGRWRQQCVYEDEDCIITVEIPREWSYEIAEWREGNEYAEASPDAGIVIRVDEKTDSKIYIFRQMGHISNSGTVASSSFETDAGVIGIYYSEGDNDRVTDLIVFGDGFYGASIQMDRETYFKWEHEIDRILRKITIETKNNK